MFLFFHIHRHARLKIHGEFALVYGDFFNQPSDKLLIVFGYGGGLLPKESAHVINPFKVKGLSVVVWVLVFALPDLLAHVRLLLCCGNECI
jgi:hypothetical protein